jgi:isoleucyl-tRNA synthetase
VGETARRFLGTIFNTYNFFAMNANAARPDLVQAAPPGQRDALDRWVLARLNALVKEVTEDLEQFALTPAARKLDVFVDDLSNWYVRRGRRKFWEEQPEAFATLWECLETLARLLAPFTPFASESLYQRLHGFHQAPFASVHLAEWPVAEEALIDAELLESTEVLQRVVSLGRAARAESGHRVRQPLPEVLVRVRNEVEQKALEGLADQLKEELNVKALRFLGSNEEFLDYDLKPNLRIVGRKYGKLVPALKERLTQVNGKDVAAAVAAGQSYALEVQGQTLRLEPDELLVEARSPAGYAAQEDSGYLVALSTELTPELEREGLARDLVRHIQELRKSSGLEISDRIELYLESTSEMFKQTVREHGETIASETLSVSTEFLRSIPEDAARKDVALKLPEVSFLVGLRKARCEVVS